MDWEVCVGCARHAVGDGVSLISHNCARTIAGAIAPEDIAFSQTSIDVDVLADDEVVGRLLAAVESLVAVEPAPKAA